MINRFGMSFDINIPRSDGTQFDLIVDIGQILFVLGANGTGKSALMHRLYRNHGNTLRITAHRQTWLETGANTLTGDGRRNAENYIRGSDSSLDARWKDHNPAQRSSIAIYDLINAYNVRAHKIAQAFDNKDINQAEDISSKEDSPIKVTNELLSLSNLQIEISIEENEQVMARKNGGALYSIAELSDGERNALLIASQVLTAKEGTLILIDEPERHLHRSIISPLLRNLFAKRPDCAFIVSTHEVMLPIDIPSANTLLVSSCTFADRQAKSWDVEIVASEVDIDDDLKKDILGARRKILFVEGTENSLDKSLYRLVFPNISIVPKSDCRNVEKAVSSIRDADSLHWVQPFGIVDNDEQTDEAVATLKNKGVYALSVYSVESIYYHPEIQRRVAERHAIVTGVDTATSLREAKFAALTAIESKLQTLSERIALKAIREEHSRYYPTKNHIVAGTPIIIPAIDPAPYIEKEKRRLQDAIDAEDLIAIISRYPVRESTALDQIIKKLGFQTRQQYESAVRKLLMDDADALNFVKSFFGTLPTDISAD